MSSNWKVKGNFIDLHRAGKGSLLSAAQEIVMASTLSHWPELTLVMVGPTGLPLRADCKGKGPEAVRGLRPITAILFLVAVGLSGGPALPAHAHADHDLEATARQQAQPARLDENAATSDAEHPATGSTRGAEACVYSVSGARGAGETVNALVILARNAAACLDCCGHGACPSYQGCCAVGSCATSCAAGHIALMTWGPPELDLSLDGRPLLGSGRITAGRDPGPELKPPRL